MGFPGTRQASSHCQHSAAFTPRWTITKPKTKLTLTWKYGMNKKGGRVDLNFISLPSPAAQNWVSRLSSAAQFVFGGFLLLFLNCRVSCSDRFKPFVNGKLSECFHCPVAAYGSFFVSDACVRQVFLSAMIPPKLLRLVSVDCSRLTQTSVNRNPSSQVWHMEAKLCWPVWLSCIGQCG